MLTEISLSSAKNLGEIFLSSNKLLVPKPGTLLSELVKYSLPENANCEDPKLVEDVILHYSQGKEVENKGIKSYILSDHDSLMDNYIDDLTNIFSNQIQFARNIVNKKMQEFVSSLETNLGSYNIKNPEDFFKVRYFSLPEIFNTDIITEIKNTNKTSYSLDYLPLNTLTEEFKFEEYVLTQDENIDSAIIKFVNDLKERNVFNNYFLNNVKEYELDVPDLLEYGMLNYLFYRVLSEKTDLNFGLSIMELRSRAFNNMLYFANKIKTALSLYETNIRNGKLISSTSDVKFSFLIDKDFHVTLYEENFNKLAEKEIPIEAIFGYIASENNSDVTVNMLIERKDFYLDKWSKLRSLYMLNLQKNKINVFKTVIKNEYSIMLNQVYEEILKNDEEIKIDEKKYKEEANRRFDCFIDNLTAEQAEDLNFVALEVVAKSVFWFSNAYELLKEMNNILKLIENIDVKEAAMYSAIKYLTNYMLNQLNVVKI